MDWRTGVGWSVGNGTGEIIHSFVDSASGYGCGYPAASGRLFDGDEFGRPGSLCPLAAGHGVNILELGRGFPSAEVAAGALGLRPGSAALPLRWRQWVCGDPHWIRL